jgi:hypothetical protein
MSNSVYDINKGIHSAIEFRGLKAQYIWYLGGGVTCLLVGFALMYLCGVNTFLCLGLILLAGTGLFLHVYRLSDTYGEYGMMKKLARKNIPPVIRSNSRTVFVKLKM